MKIADKDSRLFKGLKAWLKSYDNALTFKGFAAPGDATPTATLNDAYLVTTGGTVFGIAANDGQMLVGNGSVFEVYEFTQDSVNGIIEEGNEEAVSGETVFNYVEPITGVLDIQPSKNLFDKSTRLVGKYLNSDGTLTANGTATTSANIPITGNVFVTISGNLAGMQVCFYGAGGFISGQSSYTKETTTWLTPNGTTHMAVLTEVANQDYSDTLQVELGSFATKYTDPLTTKVGTREEPELIKRSVAPQLIGENNFTDIFFKRYDRDVNYQSSVPFTNDDLPPGVEYAFYQKMIGTADTQFGTAIQYTSPASLASTMSFKLGSEFFARNNILSGEKIKIGFWIEVTNVNAPAVYYMDKASIVIKDVMPKFWFETNEITILDASTFKIIDALIWNTAGSPYGSVTMSFTGMTIKNVSKEQWLGFERGESEQQDAIVDGVVERKDTGTEFGKIVKVAGIGQSYNLHDSAADVADYTWNSSGIESSNIYASRSQFYPVSEGDIVTVYCIGNTYATTLVVLDDLFNVIYYVSGASIKLIVPPNGVYISFNTESSNVKYDMIFTLNKVHLFKSSELGYSSNVSGEDTKFETIKDSLKNDLKGNNIHPDPFFKNFDLFTQLGWAGDFNTVSDIYPFSIVNSGKFTFEKLSSGVAPYGTAFRFTPTIVHSTTVRDAGMYLHKTYMAEQGFVVNDVFRYGFWAKLDVVPDEPILLLVGGDRYATSNKATILNSTDWIWVESHDMIYADVDKHAYLGLGVKTMINGIGFEPFTITGFVVKKVTDSLWRGYEPNEDYLLAEKVANAVGEEIVPIIGATLETAKLPMFDEICAMNYGAYISNFRRNLRTMTNYWGKPKSELRVTILADSIISGTLADLVKTYLNTTWGVPTANINLDCNWGGYAVDSYWKVVESSVIYPNVDLVIISEAGGQEGLEQMIQLIQAKSNADIMIGTWSKYDPTPEFETPWQYAQMRDMAHQYQCEIWDINALLVRALQDGTYSTYATGLHLTTQGAQLMLDDFKKHIETDNGRIYNEYNTKPKSNDLIFLGCDKLMPLNSIIYSGAWVGAHEGYLSSSTIGDYIEIPFTGVGLEILFKDVNNSVHSILLDGSPVSSYINNGLPLEYCTQIINKASTVTAWYFHRLFKAIVSAKFLTNNETELEFEITIDSIVRDASDNLTSLAYTLKVNDGGWTTLGTGNIFSDSIFAIRTTGEITIPKEVFGIKNYLESPTGDPENPGSGYVFTVGDTMKFYARKTWKDSFNSNESMLRITNLVRGAHTLRITKSDSLLSQIRYVNIYK